MSDPKPRLLILGGGLPAEDRIADVLREHFDVDVRQGEDAAAAALRENNIDAVLAETGRLPNLRDRIAADRAATVLDTVAEGVCIVDTDGAMNWANRKMESFADAVTAHARQICRQALQIFEAQSGGLHETGGARSKKFTFQEQDHHYEMICSPVIADDQTVPQVVAVVWDATSGRRLQTKIDAIDSSGRELGRIDAAAVSELSPAERLKLLQDKIIRYSKDLMHFDHFAIRVLDKRTNKLEVVIAEGLPPEALEIDLYAQPEGNGISGYVAATGRSYICHDTEKDPRYVVGLEHCKSSLTVPLQQGDRVVGVYNIESESVGAFDEDDRQFAEIFARYVAMALNILDLLVVERYTTSGKITDSVVQQVADPLDQISDEARDLMQRYIGDDGMRDRLGRIVSRVEEVRQALSAAKAGPSAIIGPTTGLTDDGGGHDPLLHHKRVLVADDEPNIRKTISDVLTNLGCDVATCKDGYEACSEIEQSQPEGFDLIISDIRMPYRNGYEIYAAAQRTQAGVPVILMTGFGYDPHHSIVRASQEGLSTVLFKPFKVDQLLDEIRKALRADSSA